MDHSPADSELLARQQALQQEARLVRDRLGLDAVLGAIGDPVVVGSAALGLMAWRDLDVTVSCQRLDKQQVLAAGLQLAGQSGVRTMQYRDDTGRWNIEPDKYPDGLYLAIRYQPPDLAEWNLDIWFVDDPARQPDLAHLHALPPRLTDDARITILRIKTACSARPQYGTSVHSFDIYTAVLDDHIASLAEFDNWLASRK